MYLFIFFIIYIFLVFVLRSYLLWKKTSINPLTFNRGDDAHGYNGKVYGFIAILEFIVVSIHAFVPSFHKYLMPFWYLEYELLQWIGWSMLIFSLILVWLAQSSMKNSWRIGIDKKKKSELITEGFYAYSRNPIFLGMTIANLGLFLVLPNAFTLLIVSLSTISINTQIRFEEEFLLKNFGDKYEQYSNKVNRWVTLKKVE